MSYYNNNTGLISCEIFYKSGCFEALFYPFQSSSDEPTKFTKEGLQSVLAGSGFNIALGDGGTITPIYSVNSTKVKETQKAIISTTEIIHFQLGNTIDTHAAYDADSRSYTIVQDGFYTVRKFYRAGDVIEAPLLVTK